MKQNLYRTLETESNSFIFKSIKKYMLVHLFAVLADDLQNKEVDEMLPFQNTT